MLYVCENICHKAWYAHERYVFYSDLIVATIFFNVEIIRWVQHG